MLPDLLPCGQTLQRVDTYKYLGLLVSSDLRWSNHVGSICSKARKLLRMLYRRLYTHSNSDALFHLSIPCTSPLGVCKFDLEPIQNWRDQVTWGCSKPALRICRKSWNQSYQSLLELYLHSRTNVFTWACALCLRSYTTCVIFHPMYCVSIMQPELPEPRSAGHHTSTFTIQAFTPPNPKNLLSCGP